MVEKDRYLVVVSVLEGRNFPKRGKHKLVVEAKFDGELLATDPVEHGENPDITQELAWELDKKGLHQHRMQRTSIKVQCYAMDPHTTVREAVGYVVLDLRSASTQQSPKWHHLLHSKYAKSKPEIRLSLYIDEDNKGGEQASFRAREAPARPGASESLSTLSGVDARALKPILNEAEGFYQIGPRDKCGEHFVLSVTVAFATNLPQLIPTNIPLPTSGFFFYYSLLGNDVTNEAFFDLLNPTFPAERASVRLRSSVEALRAFFSSQPGIEIHLCCGDQSLGSAEIPLASLLKAGSTEIYMKPVTVEGAFPLEAPNRMKAQLPAVSEQLHPSVGVAIALRKEDQAMIGLTPSKDAPQQTSEHKELGKQGTSKEETATKKEKQQEAVPKQKGKKDKLKTKSKKPAPAGPPRGPSPPAPPTHDGSYTDTFESGGANAQNKTDDNVSSIADDEKKKGQTEPKTAGTESPQPKINLGDEPQVTPILPPDGSVPDVPVMIIDPRVEEMPAVPHIPVSHHTGIAPTQPRHYCCSIDLRSVKLTEIPHQCNVFLRYTYPFFGSAAPILTHPPIETRRGAEVLIPQSFCAFDFATTPQQIADTFNGVPLIIEVWDREKDKAQNNILGAVQLILFNVLQEQRARAVHSNGTSGWRQVVSQELPIMTVEGPSRKLGELQCVVSLEDWGPVNTQALASQQSSQSSTAEAPGAPPVGPSEPRQTVEYQAALELEMWKEQQEQLFENQLKDKEAQYMKALSEEWKRRDKEREILMQKRISEYQQMEEKMRKTIGDLDRRDKQLAANEQEVMRLRADLQREHERKMLEMREASRRMKEDCDHQVQLEKTKTKELEDYILRLKNQLGEAEVKYQSLDKEFAHYREQQNTKPEVRLQSEINLLTLEKVELERKLDSATKSKVHYKQQWTRALKELARLKQKEQAAAKAQLKRQQQELEHMRLRYLAAEEKEVVKTEKKELEEIRQQLQTLKEAELGKSSHGETLMPLPPDQDDPDEDHITRLIEERDTLLRTGVYTTEDRIIAELDRQIREAIARKGGTVR